MNKSILALHAEYFEDLDKKLIKLHAETQKNGKKVSDYYPGLLPIFYRDQKTGNSEILISGINPSFTKSFYKSIDIAIFNYYAFLKQTFAKQEVIIEKLIEIQDSLIHGGQFNDNELKQINYFKTIKSFLNSVEYAGSWDHYDIFPIRCTSQHLFLKTLEQFEGYKLKAIDLYQKNIKKKKYKLVLVFNRSASQFILKNFNLMPTTNGIFFPNKIYGFYESNLFPKTKFFLFKMLSGRNRPNKQEYEILTEIVSKKLQEIQ